MKNNIVAEDIERIIEAVKDEVKKLEGKTILISGGAGFIGSYIISTIHQLNKKMFLKPCRVVCLDNYITGSKKFPFGIENSSSISFINFNVIKPFKIKEKIDYIIHAAGIASPVYYKQSPLETIDVTIQGVRNLLELGREKKVKSFLYFSSSEIYGDPDPRFIPTPEHYRGHVSSIGPRSPYDESKRLGETICMVYNSLYKLPTKIVRPFNVYGPGMKPTDYRVIPMFLSKGLRGEALPVHHPGRQTRTFCYISDAVIAFLKVFLSGKDGNVYNVGSNDREMTMYQLARKVARLLGDDIKIQKIPYPNSYPADEPQRRRPDLTKIRKDLGYKPAIGLDEGLKRIVIWYKDTYKV